MTRMKTIKDMVSSHIVTDEIGLHLLRVDYPAIAREFVEEVEKMMIVDVYPGSLVIGKNDWQRFKELNGIIEKGEKNGHN